MKIRGLYLWLIAALVTLFSAYYQRVTGPTYPLRGSVDFNGKTVNYRFERSHLSSADLLVSIPVSDSAIAGIVRWKRYKSNDDWTAVPMQYRAGSLVVTLPRQPSAGKLLYSVELIAVDGSLKIPAEPVIIRFRDDVPAVIMIPHILFMFLMMLFSTRAGLEIFNAIPRYRLYTYLTLLFVIIGGMILGPITQKYAFGAYWTGIPFGHDLTDNKTLIALLAWLTPLWPLFKNKDPRRWLITAAVITFIVFLIPHSVLGSERDYRN